MGKMLANFTNEQIEERKIEKDKRLRDYISSIYQGVFDDEFYDKVKNVILKIEKEIGK